MTLTVRMSATPKPNIDKLVKSSNKRIKTTFHTKKPQRTNHRVALDELDTFLELVDEAIDAMNNTQYEFDKAQEKLHKLYDFCGEVPLDDERNY